MKMLTTITIELKKGKPVYMQNNKVLSGQEAQSAVLNWLSENGKSIQAVKSWTVKRELSK